MAASSSLSSTPNWRRSRSTSGWNAIACPNDRQWPSSQAALVADPAAQLEEQARLADARLADEEHDLPVAGPRALEGLEQRCPSSRSRPTNGVSPRSASTSSRVRVSCAAHDLPRGDGLGLALEVKLAERRASRSSRGRAGGSPRRSSRAPARPPAAGARPRWWCRRPPCSPCAGRCRCCRPRRGRC